MTEVNLEMSEEGIERMKREWEFLVENGFISEDGEVLKPRSDRESRIEQDIIDEEECMRKSKTFELEMSEEGIERMKREWEFLVENGYISEDGEILDPISDREPHSEDDGVDEEE